MILKVHLINLLSQYTSKCTAKVWKVISILN